MSGDFLNATLSGLTVSPSHKKHKKQKQGKRDLYERDIDQILAREIDEILYVRALDHAGTRYGLPSRK